MLLFLLFLRCFLMVTHCSTFPHITSITRRSVTFFLFTFRASNDTQHMQSNTRIYTNSLLITNNSNIFHLLFMLMLLFLLFCIVMDTTIVIMIRLCCFYITLLTVKVVTSKVYHIYCHYSFPLSTI